MLMYFFLLTKFFKYWKFFFCFLFDLLMTYSDLNVIQEGERVDKLNSGSGRDLEFELSVLQLSNESVDFRSSLHWQQVVNYLKLIN